MSLVLMNSQAAVQVRKTSHLETVNLLFLSPPNDNCGELDNCVASGVTRVSSRERQLATSEKTIGITPGIVQKVKLF